MCKYILTGILLFYLSIPSGEGIKCYHCYDSFNRTIALSSLEAHSYNSQFVRCDKNQLKWNTWECPPRWPVCILMGGSVQDHYERVRSCGEKDFCSKYVPPAGVKLDYCRECNTTMCNDYPTMPEPPVGPGPLFVFNINVNLNLKKYPYTGQEEDSSKIPL